MEVVKKTDDYTIVKKRSGRFGVKKNDGKWVNSTDKVNILLDAGLITAAAPKAVAEAPVEEAPKAE